MSFNRIRDPLEDLLKEAYEMDGRGNREGASRGRLLGIVLLVSLSLWGCATKRPVKVCVPNPAATPVLSYQPVSWSRVDGWSADRPDEAWSAFIASCGPLSKRSEWSAVCNAARSQTSASSSAVRSFFEQQLTAYQIVQTNNCGTPNDSGLVTGYYEPVLRGARTPTSEFRVPLYATPEDLLTIDLGELYPDLKGRRLRGRLQGKKVVPYFSRAQLEKNGQLAGKEIVWVDNAIDAFFLQIQGSGRVTLPDGQTIRVGYADQNGHPYRSIGKFLVDGGYLTIDQATTHGLKQWLLANPDRMQQVLDANPSYVFFREDKILDPAEGPKGALGVALTPGRSVAVDPRFIPLGAPVVLATTYPAAETPLQRLVLAQDTGGAINGAVRADYFWGMGSGAGENAGKMRQKGRMWLLWPKGFTPVKPQ
jgi:membrane-bound lytic murein transglycosylase A